MRHRRRSRFGVALVLFLTSFAVACTTPASSGPIADVAGAIPFADGESLRYSLHNDLGEVIGYGDLSVRADGGTFVLEQRYVEADPPAGAAPTTDIVAVRVDAATLKPVGGSRLIDERAANGARARLRFEWSYGADDEGRAAMTSTRIDGEDRSEREVRLRDHYYDNESALWLWRTLAFREEFEQQYISVNPIERSQQTVNIRVPLRQTITVPAGEFDTWRLLLRNGRAVRTAWVNAAPPHQVVQWDNGDIVFKLEP
ncbi:MAG: DUF3108 domain-containing protein [Chloroflexi bacterium]|nr:DUF3108 domain-containing protein [Chloroflexota bacterium]MDA1001834.1 DUF3108 domain-containing protein [Chloroflexota bacterium]MQC27457.1 DUF3108 domain-containing protein [Chloroflexota bacterium]